MIAKACDRAIFEISVAQNFEWYLKNYQGECSENALVYFHCRAEEHCAQRNEKDDETELNYFGARYLDPMLGLWTSVDPARQFSSPYLYAGNGYNPVNVIAPDGNEAYQYIFYVHNMEANTAKRAVNSALAFNAKYPNADYAIKYAENQQQLIQIINNGKTSVMITHGLETYDGEGIKICLEQATILTWT